MEQGRLADAVAADETDVSPGHDLHGAVLDQKTSGDPDRYVGDGKHAALSPQRLAKATAYPGDLALKSAMWPLTGVDVVLTAQLIQEVLQTGRRFEIVEPQVALQPFADGIAYRPAGGRINGVRAIIESPCHCMFQFSALGDAALSRNPPNWFRTR